jgi:hypothetical protein
MNEQFTRRGFVARLGRLAALAGLGVLAARLLGRPSGKKSSRATAAPCRQCALLQRCDLPDALETRSLGPRTETDGRNLPVDGNLSAVNGLCGRQPGSRWIRRETT